MKDLGTSYFTMIAIQAALLAGEQLKRGFGTSFSISSKPGKQNLVTEYDTMAEDMIISLIEQHFPDHSVLAEESGATNKKHSTVTWIVDPLDGTVNFAHNVPVFSVSIAAALGQETLCGVVYQPMTNELFVAEKGKGAFLNGHRLNVSEEKSLENAYLTTGFPYNVDENPLQCIDRFASLIKLGIPIRRLGSAAIDLSYVAAGRFDAYWEVSLQPWDLAAGKLLVEEAGGRVTKYDNTACDAYTASHVLATNGHLHPALMGHLRPS